MLKEAQLLLHNTNSTHIRLHWMASSPNTNKTRKAKDQHYKQEQAKSTEFHHTSVPLESHTMFNTDLMPSVACDPQIRYNSSNANITPTSEPHQSAAMRLSFIINEEPDTATPKSEQVYPQKPLKIKETYTPRLTYGLKIQGLRTNALTDFDPNLFSTHLSENNANEDRVAVPQSCDSVTSILSPAVSISTIGSTSANTRSRTDLDLLLNNICDKAGCHRTVRGPRGTRCKYHKQNRFCRADGCQKSAKSGGFCIAHGGGKRCSYPECPKSAKQGGLCISHGGGKRCSALHCTKSALLGGFCSSHGGGRKCRVDQCTKTALLGGTCIAHGGGKRCQVSSCTKSAVGGLYCVSHGGGKRCQDVGCDKGAVRHGFCIRHGGKRQRMRQELG